MAEIHIIGQILNAIEFEEPNLFIKWSIQFGSNWKHIEGCTEGQTVTSSKNINNLTIFAHPIDLHLACCGLQGWPKLHVEIFAINALNNCWPVGYGFVHCPTQPGFHRIVVQTWKCVPNSLIDRIKFNFNTIGYTVSKSDLIYSGTERYKLSTKSSGSVTLEILLICKNFAKFGIDLGHKNN